ncbi:MAG: hypothetical protein JWM44_729 [Bacilli bacterium]|nr:hypothetical protein [Bacilli bacterium]
MDITWTWADINYWAVIVSMVATLAIGFVWYSPILFKNIWMKLVGLRKENIQGKAAGALIGALILSFVINFIVAILLQLTHSKDLSDGIWIGIFAALIVIISIGVNFLFERRSQKLFWITAGYNIITILVATIILASWHN